MACVLQERLRQGIQGVHFTSLKEHLDEHTVKQVLGEVLHRTGHLLDGPAPDLSILTTVVMSRCFVFCSKTDAFSEQVRAATCLLVCLLCLHMSMDSSSCTLTRLPIVRRIASISCCIYVVVVQLHV